ncbi:enoyl-CoA hydratase/isomerase family protein [Allosalinactinospora lopnorensis]|uniref:enoyl-CoA hydratase/isomerase family protein n=1 Tax=Allosalinactinospora lopnorensis TaxID=1352348 RepID=UPI000623E456|nr:enoyl-CoA hydratase/isomerase family protein [Allosalinactinospora lopnorensis]
MAVEDDIQLECDGHVARVWLNRPWKRNSVNLAILNRLDEIITEVDNDPELRVLVLRGREGTFCSGFDLDELQSDYVGSTTGWSVAVDSARICDNLYQMKTPTVAVLEGYTTAGGFELMISCDFAIASDDALIGDFHIRRALFGGAGPIYRVPRMIGLRKTKELMLAGKLLTGLEAADWNLINASAPQDELDQVVEDFIANLTDKSPFQMQVTKMTIDQSLDASVQSMMVMERLAVGVTLQSEDAREGVAAFLEKRDPKWTGR